MPKSNLIPEDCFYAQVSAHADQRKLELYPTQAKLYFGFNAGAPDTETLAAVTKLQEQYNGSNSDLFLEQNYWLLSCTACTACKALGKRCNPQAQILNGSSNITVIPNAIPHTTSLTGVWLNIPEKGISSGTLPMSRITLQQNNLLIDLDHILVDEGPEDPIQQLTFKNNFLMWMIGHSNALDNGFVR